MSEDNDKSNDHYLISTYIDFEILPSKFFFPLTLGLTGLYLLQKINDNFMARWLVCFYPILFFIILQFLLSIYRIIKTEIITDEDNSFIYNGNAANVKINIENLDKIILISNFFKMILSSCAFYGIYNLAQFLDYKKDENLIYTIYMIIGSCVSYIIYYFIRLLAVFSIKRPTPLKDKEAENEINPHSYVSFLSTLTAPILTYLSNMMIVCSANSGVCTQIYASTIASLLGAFGVTISDFSEYLFPITIILLGVSLFSLYAKKRSLLHKPFLLGVFSCIFILVSHFNENNKLYYLVYPGNIFMIGAAIWNAKINKFYGLPRFSK